MKGLFVDTAGWMACADAADISYHAAVQARDQALEEEKVLVTSDYVIDETLTLLRIRLGLHAAKQWWGQIERSSRLVSELISPDRAEQARAIFFRYRDKDFSFTDCTSFVVMRELELREVLTTDRHFLQMGFKVQPEANR